MMPLISGKEKNCIKHSRILHLLLYLLKLPFVRKLLFKKRRFKLTFICTSVNQHKRMLGVKSSFSMARSLEFPSSGEILTLPRRPSLQHCSKGTVSPLVPRGSPRWGCCCELMVEQEIQTREGPSLP